MLKGYVRVATGVPQLKLGDIRYNKAQILEIYRNACAKSVDIIVFPELSISGYCLADLLHQAPLLDKSLATLVELAHATTDQHTILIVGFALLIEDDLYNCAAVLHNGKVLGIVPKTYLPNYNEFYEERWFSSGLNLNTSLTIDNTSVPVSPHLLFENTAVKGQKFGIEICEDLWAPLPPSNQLALQGAKIIFNLSASNELIGKSDYRKKLICNQSGRLLCAYVYASASVFESTTDVVFGGHCIIASNGKVIQESPRFLLHNHLMIDDIDLEPCQYDRYHMNTFKFAKNTVTQPVQTVTYLQAPNSANLIATIDPHPFVPEDGSLRHSRCEEIFSIQTHGLIKRLLHIGQPKAILGISGGLDSTLALFVTVKAFDTIGRPRQDIIGVTMPGFGTTDRTYQNASQLMTALGITCLEIPIKDAVLQHFSDIGHDSNQHDITYENAQARERTQILMDLANQYGGIVIGTGDLSELALGWATYNGDHMSMYGVNTSIPKTLVRYLVDYAASITSDSTVRSILADVLRTPVSPELLPPNQDGSISQATEDIVGPYELHDFYLYYMLRFGFSPTKILQLATLAFENYDSASLKKWLQVFYRRFFAQQFKRSALPDGPKVGSICLSPRGDLRMPSDASCQLWLDELASLD